MSELIIQINDQISKERLYFNFEWHFANFFSWIILFQPFSHSILNTHFLFNLRISINFYSNLNLNLELILLILALISSQCSTIIFIVALNLSSNFNHCFHSSLKLISKFILFFFPILALTLPFISTFVLAFYSSLNYNLALESKNKSNVQIITLLHYRKIIAFADHFLCPAYVGCTS